MKKHRHSHKFMKHGLLMFALLLGLGVFVMAGIQPSYGITAQSTITATSASITTGTVIGGGTFYEGDTVNLVATPKAGYRFVNWTQGTTSVSTSATYTFVATTSNRTLVAHFALIGKPTLSSVVNGGYNSIRLSWTAVTGASTYEIYRATSATGSYAKVTSVAATTYTNTGLAAGKYYYYKVRAVATTGKTTTYGPFSIYKYAKPYPATPVVTATSASYTSTKISWPAVAGANGYAIYRATTSTGTYAYVTATTSTAYTNSSLITGKTYYYKVKAYHLEGTTKVYSGLSAVKYARPVPSAPTTAVAPRTMTSAKVTWTTVTGATKYLVERATSAAGPYTTVYTASTSIRSYIDTGRTHGATYYYRVRASHLEGSVYVYGSYASVKSVKIGSSYTDGSYKVGVDIPAGEYLLFATNLSTAEFYTSTDLAGDYFLTYGFPSPNIYETLRVGEYVHFTGLKAYPIASAPAVPVKTDGSFLPGQYKVGRDIPAGDYVINYTGTTEYGDLYIESDSLNEIDSIVGQDSYRGRIYVTLTTGQYFTFDYGVTYPISIAPALDKSQPYLHDGMYLVGTDIPSGTYTIVTKDVDYGYYVIYPDATHLYGVELDFDWLETNKTVTVTDGQYLFVFEGYFVQQ